MCQIPSEADFLSHLWWWIFVVIRAATQVRNTRVWDGFQIVLDSCLMFLCFNINFQNRFDCSRVLQLNMVLKKFTYRFSLLCLFSASLTFPGGTPTGTLCGEPSAPLRRCQQTLLFPKNLQPELTTIHNSGAAMVWNQRREVPPTQSDRACFQNRAGLNVLLWRIPWGMDDFSSWKWLGVLFDGLHWQF